METGIAVAAVEAYFAAINARDAAGIRALFEPDGELVTPAGRVSGAAAIADFYSTQAFGATDLRAVPGPLMISGNRVSVEIRLRMHGLESRVADFFEIDRGRIGRLSVYLGGPV